MTNLRNLALRPAKPALGNGRVQRLAKRALLMLDGDASTREVLDWLLLLKQPLELHDQGSACFAVWLATPG